MIIEGLASREPLEPQAGRILIQTTVDTVESTSKVEITSAGLLSVYDNNFKMDFSINSGETISPVQAFQDGAFFVEDFVCAQTN